MLSNAYFLAKFRFDTAENEPAKNLQNFAKFGNYADPSKYARPTLGRGRPRAPRAGGQGFIRGPPRGGPRRRGEAQRLGPSDP